MGCGLNKLEKRDEKRPGNIYSTLKRPQVETKIDVSYEYRFLEFTTLSAAVLPRSSAVRLASLRDLPAQLLGLYQQGFSLAALHPFVQPTLGLEKTPLEHIFRAILIKKTDRSQKSDPHSEGYVLELDCCSSLDHLTDQKLMPEFIKKVQEAASQGLKFVGVIPQYRAPTGSVGNSPATSKANSTAQAGDTESTHDVCTSSLEHENPGAVDLGGSPTEMDQSLEPGQDSAAQLASAEEDSEDSPRRGTSQALYGLDSDPAEPPAEPFSGRMEIIALFNKPQSHRPCRQYYPVTIPLRVSRNGQTVSSLDANWLEHMSSHFRKGGALVNAVFYLGAVTDSSPGGLTDGVFIFEAVSSEDSKTIQGYDAIVVEQWTVLEGVEVQTDYVPLLNSLAAYGWQLTCVLPTPVIKTTREGSVSTKQIVFLQRPCLPQKLKKKESKFQWRFSREERHLRRSKGRLRARDKRQAEETDKASEDCVFKAGDVGNCVLGPQQERSASERMRSPGQQAEGDRPGSGEALQNGPAGHCRAPVGGSAGHPDGGAEEVPAEPIVAEAN
ncbi:raftlin isoform X3 [Ochotona curzoniae]|nr:raftlin isoform X3 [Ochotona curzoniae]